MNIMRGSTFLRLISLTVMIWSLGACQPEKAANVGSEPDLLIFPDTTNCENSIVIYAGDNNCDKDQCGDQENCVCAAKNQTISWFIAGKSEFRLAFNDGSPFKGNCGDKFTRKTVKCKVDKDAAEVKDNFRYSVILKDCDMSIDPRIVIKSW